MASFWKPKLTDWKKLNLDSLQFILDQAHRHLAFNTDIAAKITDRAFSLILFLFPMLSACIVALVLPSTRHGLGSVLSIFMGLLGMGLSYCTFSLLTLIFPRLSLPPGRQPSKLTESRFLENPVWDAPVTHKFLILDALTNIEAAIVFHQAQNSTRLARLRLVMRVMSGLLAFTAVGITTYIIWSL